MKLKNDFAILLLFPLCLFTYFWVQDTIALYNKQVVKGINPIQYIEEDVDIIDKSSLEKEITDIIHINTHVNIYDIRTEIKDICGVKECYIGIDIDGMVNILLIPVKVIAQYHAPDGNVYYVDSDWNFLLSNKNKNARVNIVKIYTQNEDMLQSIEYKEKINKLLTFLEGYIWKMVIHEDGDVYIHDILSGDIHALNLHDDNLENTCYQIKQKIINNQQ